MRLDEVAVRHRKRESQLTCERFIVRAHEKLATFIELESAIRGRVQFDKLQAGGHPAASSGSPAAADKSLQTNSGPD